MLRYRPKPQGLLLETRHSVLDISPPLYRYALA